MPREKHRPHLREGMMTRFWRWLAFHLPRGLVYHCTIRLVAYATVGAWSGQVVPELTVLDALQRWGNRPDGSV